MSNRKLTAEAKVEVDSVAVSHALVTAESDALVDLSSLDFLVGSLDRGREDSDGGEENSDDGLGEHFERVWKVG